MVCIPFLTTLVCLLLVSASAGRDLIFDPFNPALSFSPSWRFAQFSRGSVFRLIDDLGLVLNITLPAGISRVQYAGLKQGGGSMYGICVNGCGDASGLQKVNAHDDALRNGATPTPVVIFNISLNPAIPHVVSIVNVPDPAFGASSRITFSSLTVTMVDSTSTASGVTSVVINLTSSAQATFGAPPSSSPTSSSGATASASDPNLTSSESHSLSRGLVAAIVILVLVATLSLLVGILLFFARSHGQKPTAAKSAAMEMRQTESQPLAINVSSEDGSTTSIYPSVFPRTSPLKPLPKLPTTAVEVSADNSLRLDEQPNTSSHQSFLSLTSSSHQHHDLPGAS